MAQNGLLITFEGGEGAGKSLHIRAVKQKLEDLGRDVVVVREPGGTAIGEAIRAILLSRENSEMSPRAELLLYEAARAQIVDEVIRPALEKGAVVLCDRFYDSSVAYQGYGRGLDRDMISVLNMIATDDLTPDATLWLDVPVDVGLHRARHEGEPDRLESEDRVFHEAVRAGFASIADLEPRRIFKIDSTQAPDEVYGDIEQVIDEVLSRVR